MKKYIVRRRKIVQGGGFVDRSYQYVKEVFGDSVSVLKLGMVNPLPETTIRDFASKVKTIYIIEELDPIIENYCKSLQLKVEIHGKDVLPICGEYSQNIIAKAFGKTTAKGKSLSDEIPVRPPIMCAGCPHRGIFYVLNKLLYPNKLY